METSSFKYKRSGKIKSLYCENIKLNSIGAKFGTPTYVYSLSSIEHKLNVLKNTIPNVEIHFAVKANSNIEILKTMKRFNVGADIVSGGELFRSILAGIDSNNIIFSGVGKTDQEIQEAILADIKLFNIESLSEMLRINYFAKIMKKKTNVLFRFNPNINAKTHPHISTGLRKNKFGLSSFELSKCYAELNKLMNINPIGLSCHIGSQITNPRPLKEAWVKLIEEAKKAPFKVTHLDLGGGLGVSQAREKIFDLKSYANLIKTTFKPYNYRLMIEPGRALIAPSSVLLTRLVTIKSRKTQSFFVVDAAMNDLIRPSLYGAVHPIYPTTKLRGRLQNTTIVGPVCESADTFEVGVQLPQSKPGDLFVFSNAGAYGMSMSSQYNSRTRAAEVLVSGSKMKLIRRRETYADLVSKEFP